LSADPGTGSLPTGWGDPPVAAPTIEAVRQAAERLKGVAVRTPLLSLPGAEGIFLKPEVLQPTGSFKLRGVMNWALSLSPAERRRGFATFSAGNTALALGYAARRFGVKASSMLPDYAPANKVAALRAAAVETTLVSFTELTRFIFSAGWREDPRAYLHPWTDPAMLAGHATIALELLDDMPDVETVFVPVGGGALAAGVGSVVKQLRPAVRVVAVQTEAYPALSASFRVGRPVWVEHGETICDGVAVPFVTDQLFPLLRRVVDEVVLVSEPAVRAAMRRLAIGSKLVVEGAGALAVAAAIERGGRGAAVVSGGAVEPALLSGVLARPDGTTA
jgi:threonine dehydratase